MHNPWTTLSSSKLFSDDWLSLFAHKVRDASGRESVYATVHFEHLGLRIPPIDRDGCTYLVGQYRFGAGYYSWELPAGGGDPNEVPLDAADRELREETGLEATQWIPLLDVVPSGSLTDHRELSFVAWGFERVAREPDPQEVLQVRRLPFREALDMALAGEIRDAGSVAAILALHVKTLRRELPPELLERLGNRQAALG